MLFFFDQSAVKFWNVLIYCVCLWMNFFLYLLHVTLLFPFYFDFFLNYLRSFLHFGSFILRAFDLIFTDARQGMQDGGGGSLAAQLQEKCNVDEK